MLLFSPGVAQIQPIAAPLNTATHQSDNTQLEIEEQSLTPHTSRNDHPERKMSPLRSTETQGLQQRRHMERVMGFTLLQAPDRLMTNYQVF
ncbi:hypothetical protein PBY51_023045 [Eleginops maclovinus]|uniref:Uncharacterized protein n=1 Tax=Eleginops maclovinus TaxID=56733 RepID=A0AAN8ADP4_ELEMC|nr:hypothetical protein PBY51_023045 [Eleginops maclovinus]